MVFGARNNTSERNFCKGFRRSQNNGDKVAILDPQFSNFKMARRKKNVHLIAGVLLGVVIGILVRSYLSSVALHAPSLQADKYLKCSNSGGRISSPQKQEPQESNPFKIIGITDESQTIHNSKRNLLFVGVMTAEKYLKTRAMAVYKTWGKELPGRLAFFSSEVSRSKRLPLVALKGVDDSYPPQKKSFMMLLYMHDNFIDKFEWFMRADDDIFIRADKLERLLRSVDSRRAQFIGQAGRGNAQEFGNLSLEYDENFCMGGTGVILSRETLKRIAPHIKECLKNLYTTHEDVELGRCVQKFAGVPCTWSYEMQSILYHNSSGNLAYTGSLKKREVHQAITLHPIKDHKHMFRIHAYLKNLKLQDLKNSAILLHRDISTAARELRIDPKSLSSLQLARGINLYPEPQGAPGYLGDTSILGVTPNLNRYRPTEVDNVLSWNFISKAVYSPDNANPKRRMEMSMKEGLDDIIRELMENINGFSKQRGRVIDFREILYGYERLDPIHGTDYILDILLVYKKYRGRKMTVPVRRHAYLQQSFTGIEIREVPLGEVPVSKAVNEDDSEQVDYDTDNMYPSGQFGMTTEAPPGQIINMQKLNSAFKGVSGFLRIGENLPYLFKQQEKETNYKSKAINLILPLSGRYETFVRFMTNYEEICLKNNEKTSLTVVVYRDIKYPNDFNKTVEYINYFSDKYPNSHVRPMKILNLQFSRGHALENGVKSFEDDDLLFFIDVDIHFDAESLQRIRLNTIKRYQVYFPIVFSEYDPSIVRGEEYNSLTLNKKDSVSFGSDLYPIGDHVQMKAKSESDINKVYKSVGEFSDDKGYWRQFGFGIASMYKCDFSSVGGFNIDIKGWGLEDVHLYDKFVQSNLSIFRSVDPGLVHVFHPVDCDTSLQSAQLTMCKGTRANTFGSLKHMLVYLFNHPSLMSKLTQSTTVNNKPNIVPPAR